MKVEALLVRLLRGKTVVAKNIFLAHCEYFKLRISKEMLSLCCRTCSEMILTNYRLIYRFHKELCFPNLPMFVQYSEHFMCYHRNRNLADLISIYFYTVKLSL